MPVTSDDEASPEYAAGAHRRAEHRRLMAVRWRNIDARKDDRAKSRLPQDWHDWMGCPANDGYATRGCVCDLWAERGKRVNSPVHQRDQERLVRSTLMAELRVPIKERMAGKQPEAAPPEVSMSLWVKTVDSGRVEATVGDQHGPITHRQYHSDPSRKCVAGALAEADPVDQPHSHSVSVRKSASKRAISRWTSGRAVGRLGRSSRVRVQAWVAGIWRYVPRMWSARGAAR
jgi:hypothetical protein